MLRPGIQADVRHAARREVFVNPGRAAIAAMHLSERARVDQPLVQAVPTHTKRILETLIRPSTVTIHGDGEALNAESLHRHSQTVEGWNILFHRGGGLALP